MTGHAEELALERLAADEHVAKAEAFWQAGNYVEAMREVRMAEEALVHIRLLSEPSGGPESGGLPGQGEPPSPPP